MPAGLQLGSYSLTWDRVVLQGHRLCHQNEERVKRQRRQPELVSGYQAPSNVSPAVTDRGKQRHVNPTTSNELPCSVKHYREVFLEVQTVLTGNSKLRAETEPGKENHALVCWDEIIKYQ